MERVYRCTWRPRSSELRDALGGRDGVNSEMDSVSVIERLEMQLEAVIEQVSTCTWWPRSTELRDALGGRI